VATGLLHAQGALFCKLDDDDLWAPDFLAKMVSTLDGDPTSDLAFSSHSVIDAAGRQLQGEAEAAEKRFGRDALPAGRLGSSQLIDAVFLRNSVPLCGSIHRTANLKELGCVDRRAGYSIDFFVTSKVVLRGRGGFYVPERLMHYRRHRGSGTTTQRLTFARDHQRAVAILLREHLPIRVRAALRRRLLAATISEAHGSLLDRDRHNALGAATRSLALAPFGAGAWAALASSMLPYSVYGSMRGRTRR
jgi:hypothetical protein